MVVFSGSPLFFEPMAGLLDRVGDCYPCLLGMPALLDNDAAGHAGRIAGWLARVETLGDQAPQQAGVGQRCSSSRAGWPS